MTPSTHKNTKYRCVSCGEHVATLRWERAGMHTCLRCGESHAKATKHTIVPMPKSNYIVVTDTDLLKGLNSSHRGNR